MPVFYRSLDPHGPHASVEGLVAEAQAVPLLWERQIGFTYYRDETRLLLVHVDRVLEPDEMTAFDALLEAHQGEPAGA